MPDVPDAQELSPDAAAALNDLAQPKFDPAWQKKKRKVAAGMRVEDRGKPLPQPATPKEAKQMVKKLAVEAMAMVVEDKAVPTATLEKYGRISHTVKAHILSYLGEDIEAAKQEFQRELLANARQVSQHIMGEFQDYPPSVKAFVFTSFVDKAQAMEAKTGVSAAGAKVGNQVNVFMSGDVDREKIIAQLTGEAFGVGPEKKAEAVEVKATPP